MLHKRELIPPLTIRTADGRVVSAWDFKQKKNLVIVFLDANCVACEEFLHQITALAAELKDKNAVALVVFLEPVPVGLAESVAAEIILGADVAGHSIRRFLGLDAASPGSRYGRGVFVTDRYGEISAASVIEQHAFPGPDEILTSLEQVQIACEECLVPDWPVET